jgi:[CysO sulfur-carrier protein]-S-L-cysteine hydrolase
MVIALSGEMRRAMIDQARREYPNEACAVIVGSAPAAAGGMALRYVPTRNEAASPLRFRVHADDLYRLSVEADDRDEVFWAIVHSHTHSPARPSATDLGQARSYPDALWILVSLAATEADPATGEPGIRAWQVVDGAAHELELAG